MSSASTAHQWKMKRIEKSNLLRSLHWQMVSYVISSPYRPFPFAPHLSLLSSRDRFLNKRNHYMTRRRMLVIVRKGSQAGGRQRQSFKKKREGRKKRGRFNLTLTCVKRQSSSLDYSIILVLFSFFSFLLFPFGAIRFLFIYALLSVSFSLLRSYNCIHKRRRATAKRQAH